MEVHANVGGGASLAIYIINNNYNNILLEAFTFQIVGCDKVCV